MHAFALALLLALAIPVVGTESFFSADEGAAVAQARLLADGDGWTMAHPFPAADPSGEAFPLELSQRRGDQYAPFAKHPLYALLLAGADDIGGRAAMVLLSVMGTWCAAVLGALVARRLVPGAPVDVLTLWLLGLVSPLFFDGYVVIAHTLGAACVALAALCFVRVVDRGASVPAVAGLAAALFAAILFRTEAQLLAVGVGVALAVLARRRRDRVLLLVAVVPVVVAAAGRVLESRWVSSIMGGASGDTAPLGNVGRGGVLDHLHGFLITVLLPSYAADAAAVLTLTVAVLVIAAGYVIVHKPEDRQGPIVFLGVAAVSGIARLFLTPGPVSGLIVAFPLLLLAAVVAPRRQLAADDRVAALIVAATVFAVLVVATQYSEGGVGEWGGRYFAIGLPLVVPVVALALTHLSDRLQGPELRTVVALTMCAVLALSGLALRSLREAHQAGDDLVSGVVATAAQTPAGDGGLPVVLSIDGATARYSVDHLDEGRYLTVKLDDVSTYAARLHQLGVQSFTLVVHHEDDFARATDYRVRSVSQPVGGWYVAAMGSA